MSTGDPAQTEDPSLGEPDGWLETVTLEGDSEPTRVVLHSREGNLVLLRHVDPSDGENPPRTPLYPGDQFVVMTPIAAIGHHLSEEVGRTDDFLFGQRITEVRREPGTVFVRTLRPGEPDDGRRVHVRPGDQVTFEEGALVAHLDDIDEMERGDATGYTAVTPVLWTWMTLGVGHDEVTMRYVLAAARRLDAAAGLLSQVEHHRSDLNRDDLPAPRRRRALFDLIGSVELAMVALGRVVDMAYKAPQRLGTAARIPESVDALKSTVNEIRNAYEHIEDRAQGQVWGKPDPRAVTIFDHQQLIESDAIVYGDLRLSLIEDVPLLLREMRQFLKDVAGTGSRQNVPPPG